MKPQYEQYRADGKGSHLKAFRLPIELYSHIERLAEIEGDSITSLVIEGLARVLEDRASPENLDALASTLHEQVDAKVSAMRQWAEQVTANEE